jgi:hypothetical protein
VILKKLISFFVTDVRDLNSLETEIYICIYIYVLASQRLEGFYLYCVALRTVNGPNIHRHEIHKLLTV